MEKTEMNKVIAEFMELGKCSDPAHKDNPCFYVKESQRYATYEDDYLDLKYHESWDWLMPVWAKLRPMLCERYMPTRLGRIHIRIENALLKPDITEAHKAIFEAITYLKSINK